MKISNKILLGGFISPIVAVVLFVIFMSFNTTNDVEYQMGSDNINFRSNNIGF